jgi:hypothetical protein
MNIISGLFIPGNLSIFLSAADNQLLRAISRIDLPGALRELSGRPIFSILRS